MKLFKFILFANVQKVCTQKGRWLKRKCKQDSNVTATVNFVENKNILGWQTKKMFPHTKQSHKFTNSHEIKL